MTRRACPGSGRLRRHTAPESGAASLRRDVLKLAWPAMGRQILNMMVGLVDTYLVGHLGAAPLAAVGPASQWVFMANSLFGSISTVSTALMARLVGARAPDQAERVVQQSVLLGFLIVAD